MGFSEKNVAGFLIKQNIVLPHRVRRMHVPAMGSVGMTAMAFFECLPASVVKALSEISQVIRITGDLPFFGQETYFANDGASNIAGNDKTIEDATFSPTWMISWL